MASPSPSPTILEAVAAITPCWRGEAVYARGEPAEHWYRLVSGMARESADLTGGRRRILGFLLPGEFFGFSARDEHALTVEAAVEGAIVARYPRRQVEMLADHDPRVARYLREMTFQALSRAEARSLILGRTTAREKLGALLADIAARSSDGTAGAFVQSISRRDIADHLGLSVGTVSRALGELEGRQAITRIAEGRATGADHAAPEDGDGSG